ncbi:MAG: peptidyl-prolyl cis-trans isomerase [bacterium]
MMMKWKVSVFVTAMAILAIPACTASKPAGESNFGSNSAFPRAGGSKGQVVFTVGPERFTDEDIRVMLKAFNVPEERMLADEGQLKGFINQLMDEMLLERQGGLEGIEHDPEVQMRARLTHMRIVADAYSSKFLVPDTEMQKYYDEHKDDYIRVGVAMLVTKTQADGKKATAEAREGADFDEVAKKFDENAKRNGRANHASFMRSQQPLPENVQKVVYGVKENEVSDPIEISGQGQSPVWIVIKVLERKELTLDEAKESISGKLRPELIKKKLEELRTTHGVKVNDDVLAKMVIKKPESVSVPLPEGPVTPPPKSEPPKKPESPLPKAEAPKKPGPPK